MIEPPKETRADRVRGVIRTHMLPTREGLNEAEKYIATGQADTAASRLNALIHRAGLAGLDWVKDVAAGVPADVIGGKI